MPVSNLLRRLRNRNDGAAMVEFSIVVGLLLTLTSGLVEFGMIFHQWNSASKAAQLGARLAAVSSPVASDLSNLTGMESGALPGDPFPFFERICSGATTSCGGGSYDGAAMNTLVFGRGDAACQTVGTDNFPGMCDVFPRIQASNVIVTYRHTGLGFAGRPGGPVPTVTVELTGLTFDFVFLDDLLGLGPIQLPNVRTTVTGEDLSTLGS